MSDDACGHVDRVAIHPSIKIGGASIGVCDRKRLPGMTVCAWHADPDAVTMMMTQLAGGPTSRGAHPVPTCLTADGKRVLLKPVGGNIILSPGDARELALKLESMADKVCGGH